VTPHDVVFVLLAIVTGSAAVAVVTARNLVHAALFLATTLGGMAGVFLVLHADFVALVQLLIYVGAVAVLLMFGLMLTRAPIGRETLDGQSRGLGLAVSIALFGVLAALIWQAYGDVRTELVGQPLAEIGLAIFSRWVLPFEVASVLLLAALIGAIVLARRESGESGPPDDDEPARAPGQHGRTPEEIAARGAAMRTEITTREEAGE
jgi:NADH-quinone oxidoreductase subunit J